MVSKRQAGAPAAFAKEKRASLRQSVSAAAFHGEASLWWDLFSSCEPIKYLRMDNPAIASQVLNQHQSML